MDGKIFRRLLNYKRQLSRPGKCCVVSLENIGTASTISPEICLPGRTVKSLIFGQHASCYIEPVSIVVCPIPNALCHRKLILGRTPCELCKSSGLNPSHLKYFGVTWTIFIIFSFIISITVIFIVSTIIITVVTIIITATISTPPAAAPHRRHSHTTSSNVEVTINTSTVVIIFLPPSASSSL